VFQFGIEVSYPISVGIHNQESITQAILARVEKDEYYY